MGIIGLEEVVLLLGSGQPACAPLLVKEDNSMSASLFAKYSGNEHVQNIEHIIHRKICA